MRGSHRCTQRRKRLITHAFYSAALALTLALAVGPFGLVSAGAVDRSRDGSFSSDTDVITTDDGNGSGAAANSDTSGARSGSLVTSHSSRGHQSRVPAPSNNVTICHATAATNNPFNPNTVDVSSSGGQQKLFDPDGHASHDGTPSGNFFTAGVSQNGDDWTDIIPPFYWPDPVIGPNFYPGLGWTAAGQAIHAAGCQAVPILGTPIKTGPASAVVGSAGNTYTLSVTNTGAAAANAVTFTDNVNAAFTVTAVFFTKSNPAEGPTACAVSNSVSCNVGTLQPGQSATVTITFSVPGGAACTTIPNTGSVAATGLASQVSNTVNTTITGCGAPPAPDISITKSGPTQVNAGQQFSYTITVINLGNADALGVTVSDTVPTGLTINSVSPTPACSFTGQAVSCSLGTVSSGSPVQITITVTPTTCGPFANSATVSTTSTNDSNTGNHTAGPVNTSVICPPPPPAPAPLPPPGIDITKTGPVTAKVGDTVTYNFAVVLASGSPSLTGVSITDPICDPGTLAGPTGDDGDSVLEGGEAWGFSCTHVVTASDPDPLPNTATVCATAPGGGTVCDSDNHEVDITHPAIEVVKTADPTSGSAGTVITFTYTVTNSGDVPLFDVTVDDDVLGHICDIAVLQPQTTVVCTGTYTIPAGSPSEITNIVIAAGTDPAGDLVEDQDDFTITVVAGTTITKTPPGGVAFTGPATAIPIAALALLLLAAGSGLLWLGRRRGRMEGTQS